MKKYFIIIIVIFCLSTIMLSSLKASVIIPLIGKKIVIDPGHGGKDPGTLFGNIYEKDINLKISEYLKESLEKYGAAVIMTRYHDYDLSSPNALYRKKSDFDNRILVINSSKSDLYVSIHLNYLNDSRYRGLQIFYDKDNENIALSIQQSINTYLNNSKSIKKIPKSTYMYDKLTIPGILIECGFLSNKSEREKLITSDYQKELAESISKSIVSHFT